jgi:hypothetical protein
MTIPKHTALILLIAVWGLSSAGINGQYSGGIGTLKSVVDRTVNENDIANREAAIKALSAAGGVESVRHLL